MATDRAGDFLKDLRESQLLEPAQIQELTSTPDTLNTDPQLLAQCLVEMGWLTRFQVDHLPQARGLDLKLGSYQLVDRFGIGGTGPAFKARRPGKKGAVALKVIRKNRLSSPAAVTRFMADVRAAAVIQHENIAPVVTVGQLGGKYLFAREFVEGTDLEHAVRAQGPLPPIRACEVIRQAALALHHAHTQGLEHRRIKAANLITVAAQANGSTPTIKVVDFGLAQIESAEVLPTLKPADPRADLQGLGRTLRFLLTGQTSDQVSGIPWPVRTVLDKLLSGTGYTTAEAAAQALEPLCREAPPEPSPVDLPVAVAAVAVEVAPEPELPVAVAAVAVDMAPEPELPVAVVAEEPPSSVPWEFAPEAPSVPGEPAAEVTVPAPEEAIPLAVAVAGIAEPVVAEVALPVAIEGVAIPIDAVASPELVEPIAVEVAAVLPAPDEVPAPIELPGDALPVAVAVVADDPAESVPTVSEITLSSPSDPAALFPATSIDVIGDAPAELPVATAAVVVEPSENDLPVASAVAFVGETPAEESPLPTLVASATEAAVPVESSFAGAMAVATELASVTADDPIAEELPVVHEVVAVEPIESELPVATAMQMVEPELPVATAMEMVEPVEVLEVVKDASEVPLASAMAIVEPVEPELPIASAMAVVEHLPITDPIVELPLATADVLVGAEPELPPVQEPEPGLASGELAPSQPLPESAQPLDALPPAAVEVASSFNPVQDLPAPELVPSGEGAHASPPTDLSAPGADLPPVEPSAEEPLLHSDILTPAPLPEDLPEERLIPTSLPESLAPALPVEMPPSGEIPPAAEGAPAAPPAPAFVPLQTPEFTGVEFATPPSYESAVPPTGDPFPADAPAEEEVTFPIGAAKDAVRRSRPKKMSWSLKGLSFWQKVGCLVGVICNLVIAPLLIYLIYVNMTSSPAPPTNPKSGGVKKAQAAANKLPGLP